MEARAEEADVAVAELKKPMLLVPELLKPMLPLPEFRR